MFFNFANLNITGDAHQFGSQIEGGTVAVEPFERGH
jgi:hypothetical protein